MKLTKQQKLILYSLSRFYAQLNQPLQNTPVKLETSKIVFIELLLISQIITKQRRALYKNLESLENKSLIDYTNKMIKFTPTGIKEFKKIEKEYNQYFNINQYFTQAKKPNKKLQTVIR
jgi:hypothetical protein